MRISMVSLLLLAATACLPPVHRDRDGDGVSVADGDCDDTLAAIGPHQTDIVGDGIDQNCDGVDGTDSDGDGHASINSGGDDCDDTDPTVSPSADEVLADGIDQDCNGADRVQDTHLVDDGVAEVDLLWVLDDSCSMYEEQGKLIAAIPAMLDALDETGAAWRIGVVTTDLDAFAASGKLRADGWSGALWVDAAAGRADASAHLSRVFDVGTGGSATEKGRAAVYTAMEIRGGTTNAGFRRDGAHFAAAVLTDEDDYSGAVPVSLEDFITWYQGFSPIGGASFHAIKGPFGGCSSSYEAGTQYAAVVAEIGGAEESICAHDYAPFLADLASWIPASFRIYPLSRAPVAGTLQVFVDPPGGSSAEVTAGWHHDPGANTVVFAEAPAAGSTVTIHYDVPLAR